jgi:hypothetical protein
MRIEEYRGNSMSGHRINGLLIRALDSYDCCASFWASKHTKIEVYFGARRRAAFSLSAFAE